MVIVCLIWLIFILQSIIWQSLSFLKLQWAFLLISVAFIALALVFFSASWSKYVTFTLYLQFLFFGFLVIHSQPLAIFIFLASFLLATQASKFLAFLVKGNPFSEVQSVHSTELTWVWLWRLTFFAFLIYIYIFFSFAVWIQNPTAPLRGYRNEEH